MGDKSVEVPNPKRISRMIVAQLPNMKVGISFKHIFTLAMVRGAKQKTRITHCALFEIPEEEKKSIKVLCVGVAKCSIHDNFDKSKGRKVALTRALLTGDHLFSGPESKGLRELIWAAYLNRGNGVQILPPKSGAPVLDGIVVNETKLLPALLDEDPVVIH